MELTKREMEMGEGKIVPLLFKFGIPTMLGMIVNAIYNLVDTYFVGGFGMVPMAAVSLVFPLTLLTTGIGCLFGTGTGSFISRLLGAKKHREAKEYAATAVASAVIAGLVLTILLECFLPVVLRFLGADNTTIPYALTYGRMVIIGFVFSIFNITANNIIVSEGATRFTSFALVLGAVLNMILDPVFVYCFHMGVEGIALSTVISSGISSVLYLLYFLCGDSLLRFSFRDIRMTGTFYKNVAKIGIPMLIFQLLNMATISVTNALATGYGHAQLASYGITYKLFCIESNAAFGFLKGYQPLAGYNFGAKNYERVSEFTKKGILITTAFCLVCNVLLMLFAPQVIYLFNQDSATVHSFGAMVLRVQAVGYLTLGFQFVGASYFLAIGKAKEGGVLSMTRGILFIVFAVILNAVFGSAGLLASYVVTEFVASLVTGLYLIREQKVLRIKKKAITLKKEESYI